MDGVYAKLYDLVNGRLASSGRRMPCGKRAFLVAAESSPSFLDVGKLQDADNLTFFDAAFLCLLGRLPDQGARDFWQGKIDSLPEPEFRRLLLDAILGTSAAKERGARVEGRT